MQVRLSQCPLKERLHGRVKKQYKPIHLGVTYGGKSVADAVKTAWARGGGWGPDVRRQVSNSMCANGPDF